MPVSQLCLRGCWFLTPCCSSLLESMKYSTDMLELAKLVGALVPISFINSLTTKRMPYGILFDCLYCWPQILDCGELVVCGHRKIK